MNANSFKRFLAIVFLMQARFVAVSQAILPEIFSSNMVLQRAMQVPVWGTASANKMGTVHLASTKATAKSDAKGNWYLRLPALAAGGPFTLNIQSKNKRQTLQNIHIGDVWIWKGQSNI